MNGNHFFPDGEEPDSEAWELLQRLHWAFMAEYTQVTQQDLMTAFEKWVEAKTFEDLDQLLNTTANAESEVDTVEDRNLEEQGPLYSAEEIYQNMWKNGND
jgi:antirestriction protein